MPFADSKDWDDCVKKRMEGGKYTKEVAEKVCGKMKADLEKGSTPLDWSEAERKIQHDTGKDYVNSRAVAAEASKPKSKGIGTETRKSDNIPEYEGKKEYVNSKLSPGKKDLKELSQNIKKSNEWEFNPEDVLSSKRKVTGTFHVPKIDKDNELITKDAMAKAIPNFMHLPILHDFHKERVLGVITRVWEDADVYHFDALFKATPDVDDAWHKVQKGEYDHVSIYGSRLKGSMACGMNPDQRTEPCVSSEIRLDSISACDDNARNDHTSLGLAKALYSSTQIINTSETFIKAMTSGSSLSHGIYDGGSKRDSMRVREVDEKEDEEDEEEKKAERVPLKPVAEKKKVNNTQVRDLGESAAEGEKESDEVEKCESCEKKTALHKAKESLKGVYSMIKELMRDDKKMVEKDEETHKKMEKSEVSPTAADKKKEEEDEEIDDESEEEAEGKKRFKKGSKRPKVTEEPAEKPGFKQPVNKKVVEKGSLSENRSARGNLRGGTSKQTEALAPLFGDKITGPGNKRDESIEPTGRKSLEKSGEGEEEEKAAVHAYVSPKTKHFTHKTKMSAEETSYGAKERTKERNERIGKSEPHGMGFNKANKSGGIMEDEDVIQKANLSDDMTDEQFVVEIVKAALPKTDEIVKAQVDEIKKAFETQIEALKAELKEIKEQPMVKAAVLIEKDGKIEGQPLNYDAVTKFMEKR